MEYKWLQKDIEKLILLVQERDYLYSVRSKDYMDRTKKAQAFNEIHQILQKDIPTVVVSHLKTKWKSLRSQYVRELRLIKNSKKSGSGINDIYVPKLWCFDLLSFLEPHACIRESEDNIQTECTFDNIEEQGNSTSFTDESFFSSNEESNVKHTKKSKPFSQMQRDFTAFKEIITSRKKNVQKYRWLGELVTGQLEEIDVKHQQKAAWEIQSVIQKYIENFPKSLNSSTSNVDSSHDLLQMSMDGIFEESDFCE